MVYGRPQLSVPAPVSHSVRQVCHTQAARSGVYGNIYIISQTVRNVTAVGGCTAGVQPVYGGCTAGVPRYARRYTVYGRCTTGVRSVYGRVYSRHVASGRLVIINTCYIRRLVSGWLGLAVYSSPSLSRLGITVYNASPRPLRHRLSTCPQYRRRSLRYRTVYTLYLTLRYGTVRYTGPVLYLTLRYGTVYRAWSYTSPYLTVRYGIGLSLYLTLPYGTVRYSLVHVPHLNLTVRYGTGLHVPHLNLTVRYGTER